MIPNSRIISDAGEILWDEVSWKFGTDNINAELKPITK